MWRALENATLLVGEGGYLFISIYNDQGIRSHAWRTVKKLYNRSAAGRRLVCAAIIPCWAMRWCVKDLVMRRNPARRYREYKAQRGMSILHDWTDWLGGYPFEVARPEEIFQFFRQRGFCLERLKTSGGGFGCNEFVLRRIKSA
jgi:2-polyprenyl-6-hydroxyphenyl methylase/3-demethylubiquinone-9 3-methyltransferase